MVALATILQPIIDALRDQGVNKIILATHLQQLALEAELVPLLHGVDLCIAGGSDSILANPENYSGRAIALSALTRSSPPTPTASPPSS